jgi:hypothetical protein
VRFDDAYSDKQDIAADARDAMPRLDSVAIERLRAAPVRLHIPEWSTRVVPRVIV